MLGISNRSGFSLIEIMVVIALIGVLATVVVPNLRVRQPEYERKQFLGTLNGLLRLTAEQALTRRTLHRVYFDFKNNKIRIEAKGTGKDQKGEQIFTVIKAPYLVSSLAWPANLSVKEFKIDGADEMAREGRRTTEVWFYIIPEGLAQDVVINLVDMQDKQRGKPKQIGLVLNPFNAQFKTYDSFQK